MAELARRQRSWLAGRAQLAKRRSLTRGHTTIMPEEKSEKEADNADSRRASVTRSAPRSARSGSYGPQKVADNAHRGQEGVRNTVRLQSLLDFTLLGSTNAPSGNLASFASAAVRDL